jgi:hypothetical protein
MKSKPPTPQEQLAQAWNSQPAFNSIDEYLAATGSSTPPPPPPGGSDQADEPADESCAPPSTPRKPRCTKQQKIERKAMLRSWMQDCSAPQAVYNFAKKNWGLGKRSTQLYVKEIKAEWAKEAGEEDYLAHLWASKLQYEQKMHKLNKEIDKAEDPRHVASLLRVALGFQKARDLTMASVLEHRRWAKRDTSPDSVQNKHKRSDRVVMSFGELNERLDNLRRGWQLEFQRQYEELNGIPPFSGKRPEVPPVPPEGWGDKGLDQAWAEYEPPPLGREMNSLESWEFGEYQRYCATKGITPKERR